MADSIPFADVLRAELKLIEERRKATDGVVGAIVKGAVDPDVDKDMMKSRVEALKAHTTGLSFSGGGIRSGTFAVGFLQGLGTLGLLRRFDYLSTVSGGGYAGGWVAAWLKRQGDVENVELQLNPNRVANSKADRQPYLSSLDPQGNLVGQVVDEEPEPIRHLRAYSSYMTPRSGFLTADTWSIITTWGRNVIINLMMLLPLTMFVVLVGRAVVYFYGLMNQAVIQGPWLHWALGAALLLAGFLCLSFAFWNNGTALIEFRRKDPGLRPAKIEAKVYTQIVVPLLFASIFLTVGARRVLWSLSALGRSDPETAIPRTPTLASQAWDLIWSHMGLLQFPNFALHFFVYGGLLALLAIRIGLRGVTLSWRFPSSAFLAGGTGGLLCVLLEVLIRRFAAMDRPDLMATFAPSLGLMIVVGSLIVDVALLGRSIEESEREWWARFGAMNILVALFWTATLATILYVPGLFLASGPGLRALLASGWLGSAAFGVISGKFILPKLGGKGFGLTAIASLASLFFLVGMVGLVSLLAALVVHVPSIVAPSGGESGPFAYYLEGIKGSSIWLMLLMAIAAAVAAWLARERIDANLFSLNAMYANRLIRCYLGASRTQVAWESRWGQPPRDTRANVGTPAISGGVGTSVGCTLQLLPPATGVGGIPTVGRNSIILVLVGLVLHVRVFDTAGRWFDNDENTLTNQSGPLAALKLYLGRLWPPAQPSAIETAWIIDSIITIVGPTISIASPTISIPRNANPVTGFDPKDDFDLIDLMIGKSTPGVDRPYWGPHLLINTTLNLVGGKDLAWRDRKGESFLLSPLYCGSKGTGYALTGEDSRTKLTLGRALSISGAAVDPNMSFYQSAPLTALLTVFNARLGYWLEKPKKDGWKADSPKFGDYLLDELMGKTNEEGKFVHISDGGHFENLGVYELIRRRCRYIVAVDAADDGEASNDNLSIMIRLCRIDFGVRIEIDTRPLQMTGPDNLTKAHVVIGRVRYDDVDQGEMPGVLVYVRISLTGDEPPDIQKYAKKEPAFPHQPTDLRQSFDEEQFECYRCLGDHIAREVFTDADRRLRTIRSEPHQDFVPPLFSAVQSRWGESPQVDDARLLAVGRGWAALHREFRRSPDLAELSRQLYPELPPSTVAVSPDRRDRAEIHAVNQMLQFLAGAWISLDLREYPDLPGNRGWLNTFRRWVSIPAVQKYWPLVRSEFDSDFVRFCESELHLTAAPPATVPLPGPQPFPAGATFEAEAFERLAGEFAREWPAEARGGRGLTDLLQGADLLQKAAKLPIFPAWLIVQAPSGVASANLSAEKSVAGIILALESPTYPGRTAPAPGSFPIVEFVAWVRPAYRSAGLGSPVVRDILDNHLIPALRAANGGTKPELWARYPKGAQGGDNDLEGATWLNFFARYDFRKYVPPGTAGLPYTLLVRDAV